MPQITKPSEHFKVVTYNGSGANQKITLGFKPDLLWFKTRNVAVSPVIGDVIRGTSGYNFPNIKGSDQPSTDKILSFDADGVTLGADGGQGVNHAGQTMVAWCWKAGGAAVANTDGTLVSQVSVNKDAGFSIVGYRGNGTPGATFGHGLGVKPDVIIFKNRNASTDWAVYHKDTGNTALRSLQASNQGSNSNGFLNSTDPTATVVTLGDGFNQDTNYNNDFVAYCWHEVPGYSKFGTYTGNGDSRGADGRVFVYLGFRPAFIILKSISNDNDWEIYDSTRDPYNPCDKALYSNNNNAEDRHGGDPRVDFLANGFKARTTGAGVNSNGWKYMYMAFAEQPFKYANAR